MLPSLVSETSTSRKETLVGECELVNFMVELRLGSRVVLPNAQGKG